MDFALTEEQTAIFDMAHAFGQENIAPFARQWEAEGTIPKKLWPQVGELGFGGLYVSEETGGSALTRLDATLVFEALSMACPSVAAFLSIHNMCAKMLDSFASDEMKARIMPDVLSLNTVLSYCLTEPGSGSDAAALKTRADKTNEGYTLNGNKAFISGGGYSDAYVCMVRTGEDGPKGISTVYVEDGTPGLSFGGLEEKMGWKSQPTAQVQFDDCKIPANNLVGEEGKGFKYAMMGLDGGRLNISSCSLGAAQTALNLTMKYMSERKAFGKSIDQFQGLQFRLADMEIELQAARVFLRQAAWKLDQGAPDASKHCAMAKKFVTEAGSRIVDQCLQLHGGYGYLADYGIEKLVRDLRVHQILEGTNEIMRVIVARHLLAEHS
ncbi:acyl-CoA dehydrogenase family protein [Pseudophaeobacter arcticus]|uniref:acyl-CoA dehydrogenase family protein n=1 Tax=Pseudophaeobacter arcticus TaxID=385492 RepID=UPI00040738DC|nr:acyl-CoA dehydrogenase family protein [Pseudophaeobacter arcticus]